jgi:hypothetical protein
MELNSRDLRIKLVLGSVSLAIGIFATHLALFRWVEQTGLYYLLGDYARYVCAYGGFGAMIFGAMLVNDFMVLRKVLKEKQRVDYGITIYTDFLNKEEEVVTKKSKSAKGKKQKIVSVYLAFLLLMLSTMTVYSNVLYTATVNITPMLEGALNEFIWISGNDDYVRKFNKSDLNGPEILSWDTQMSYPFTCNYRVEDGNEYIYVCNYHGNPNADFMVKFHANNGTEVTKWDIGDYSSNAYGLAWNGSRWFIAEGGTDPTIFQVDPADPTVSERSFEYLGISEPHGLAWDGSYLWVADWDTHKVLQIDIYGNIQTSWDFIPEDPAGIAYDTSSGHLWIVKANNGYLYEYFTNGTEINNWDPAGTMPNGVDYASESS